MTTILHLTDKKDIPVHRREYRIERDGDEVIAIEKFMLRYHRVPETVYVWRGNAYIELREGEK